MAIRRFISRRGIPRKVLSDNGKNFIGASNDIMKIQEIIAVENYKKSVGSFMAQETLEWEMIPPRSPHFGGLWETSVKSMKRHLRRVVGLQILSFEEQNTLVIEIEGILNSRHLSTMSSDSNDLQPITPAHFLLGKSAKIYLQFVNVMRKSTLDRDSSYSKHLSRHFGSHGIEITW